MKTLTPGSFVVQLGRIGDILNVLPMIERAGSGWIICNPDFMSLADSVSYARFLPYSGHIDDYAGASKCVGGNAIVHVAQRFGSPDFARNPLSPSFATDEWLACGIEPTAENGFGSLTIDIRHRAAEKTLVQRYRRTTKPLLLVNTLGFSSAYRHREQLAAHLDSWRDEFEILDLANVHAERFSDLLGLYDIAAGLVTIDTATLHLAPACPKLPVIHLHPKGWYASPPKGNVVLAQSYDDLNFDALDATLDALRAHRTITRTINRPLEIWYAIPSANAAKCSTTFAAWQKMGYKTAALVDGDTEAPRNCDMLVRVKSYAGYPQSVNLLAHALRTADIVVTGGDDILPDPHKTAREIGNEFWRHFNGTYGVMQPTGDKWGNIELYAGSPWMGKEFIDRAYGGNGPMCPEYFHYGVDTELQHVAELLGVFWQNQAICQKHEQYQRTGEAMPAYLSKATEQQGNAQKLHDLRKRQNFPGHEPRARREAVTDRLPRIAFTIVLNGLHHLQHNGFAEKMATMFDRWVIVEGASQNHGSTAWCREMPDAYHDDGHSVDGTCDFLYELEARHANVNVLRQKGMWASKDKMCTAAIKSLNGQHCMLWQVDCDEWMTKENRDLAELVLLASGNRIGKFPFRHFVGEKLMAAGNWGSVARLWNWNGEPVASHEPPKFGGVTTELEIPISFDHYSYVFENDIRFKESFYGYAGLYDRWKSLQSEQSFPQPYSRLIPDSQYQGQIVRVA